MTVIINPGTGPVEGATADAFRPHLRGREHRLPGRAGRHRRDAA